jgi:hypothetical protein
LPPGKSPLFFPRCDAAAGNRPCCYSGEICRRKIGPDKRAPASVWWLERGRPGVHRCMSALPSARASELSCLVTPALAQPGEHSCRLTQVFARLGHPLCQVPASLTGRASIQTPKHGRPPLEEPSGAHLPGTSELSFNSSIATLRSCLTLSSSTPSRRSCARITARLSPRGFSGLPCSGSESATSPANRWLLGRTADRTILRGFQNGESVLGSLTAEKSRSST